MSDSPTATLFWIGLSLALAKFGPLLSTIVRH